MFACFGVAPAPLPGVRSVDIAGGSERPAILSVPGVWVVAIELHHRKSALAPVICPLNPITPAKRRVARVWATASVAVVLRALELKSPAITIGIVPSRLLSCLEVCAGPMRGIIPHHDVPLAVDRVSRGIGTFLPKSIRVVTGETHLTSLDQHRMVPAMKIDTVRPSAPADDASQSDVDAAGLPVLSPRQCLREPPCVLSGHHASPFEYGRTWMCSAVAFCTPMQCPPSGMHASGLQVAWLRQPGVPTAASKSPRRDCRPCQV